MGQAFDFPSGLRKTPKHLRKMRKAVAFHQQGDLAAAKKLYADVLRIDANDFDALHMSGLIAYQLKNFVEAEPFFHEGWQVEAGLPGLSLESWIIAAGSESARRSSGAPGGAYRAFRHAG